jgi:hypothetical protein
MEQPLDELYFQWLYSQVGDPRIKNPNRTYWKLLLQLYKKEFIWFVPNDDNRIEDGKDLRYEFVDAAELQDVDLDWVRLGCSMLELLIGLSRRLAFEAEGEPRDWFWHLIENLGLILITDKRMQNEDFARGYNDLIDLVLDRVIYRTYGPDGNGGLFPLRHTQNDQRKVELWYQLSEYVLERS